MMVCKFATGHGLPFVLQDTCNVKHPDPFSGSISVSNMTVGYINTTLFNADIPVSDGSINLTPMSELHVLNMVLNTV